MSMTNSHIYTGYIYLWYDTKSKFFYLGGHHGRIEDRYICSSKTMIRAYKLRPHTFKRKILEYVDGDTKVLRKAEQNWLDQIKQNELMTTKNVQGGTCRYYNVKNTSSGGNGIGTNKGNSNIGGHNKGKPMSEDQKQKLSAIKLGTKQTKEHIANRLASRKRNREVGPLGDTVEPIPQIISID